MKGSLIGLGILLILAIILAVFGLIDYFYKLTSGVYITIPLSIVIGIIALVLLLRR